MRSPRALAGTVAALVGLLGVGLLGAPASAEIVDQPADGASRFTLAVLPDTQFYSRYSGGQFQSRYGTDPFQVQTQWLADNATELEIPFAVQLGDIVDQAGQQGEWAVADRAMTRLEDAGLPYSLAPGNHDVLDSSDGLDDTSYDLAREPFNTWFGAARAAKQSTYQGSDPTGLSQYHIFEAEGQKFMVVSLTWRASDATFAWANAAIAAHPDVPVIVTSHQMIDIAEDATSPEETDYGLETWDKLIRANDQIFMTINGHFHGAASQVKANDAGHPVVQLVVDHQMAYEGGNGYLGLFEFDLTNNRVDVVTGSPWVVQKPENLLNSFDQPFLTGPNNEFTIPIDFIERFAGFAPNFTAGPATSTSLIDKARGILLDGFTAPDATTNALPGSTEDYPKVDGTLAHWRMNGLEGVVEPGASVPDVAAGADLTRATLAESGSLTAAESDVSVVPESEPYSSDGSALCFANSDKAQNRFSYLTSKDGAAVNDAALAGGYTIETFLKIDTSWTEPQNAWMKAIVRSGNRSLIGVPGTRWDWTASPVALGLSNLREFQFTEVPIDTTKGDRTNWSGEIMTGKWQHVAIVNDPATATTTMYVDGAPILRTASDTIGHGLQAGMPWLFGSDWVDDKATNGWNGCIGETRVVDHPLAAGEWLTARADLTGLTVTAAPDGASGTGHAGATVTLAGAITGSAVVDQQGVWTVAFDTPLAPGEYAFTAQQSLGSRAEEPVAASITVAPQQLTASVQPTITGTPRVGSTLTVTSGTWNAVSPTFSYQWMRDSVAITGATAATYRVTSADPGRSLSAVVTATATGFTDGTASAPALTVAKLSSSVTGSSNRLLSFGGRNVTYSGTVSAVDATPSGEVTLYDGTRVIATTPVLSGGRYTIAVPKLGSGIHLLTARYSGDAALESSVTRPSLVLVF